jgi:plasmid stabilization system protein ParE
MKHYTVVFTPRAERQLNTLYVRIADHGGQARADNYVGGIVADCLSLSTFPERGTKRDDIRPNLRNHGLRQARNNCVLGRCLDRDRRDPRRVLWRAGFRAIAP